MNNIIIHGIDDTYSEKDKEKIIREVFLSASGNCSWLKRQDIVLLKPALNSPDLYPATTDPLTIRVIAEILEEKGARVVIGDQSGIGHVLHTSNGVLRGSSRDNYRKSGMGNGITSTFVAFEEEGWDKGFDHYQSTYTQSWPKGFYITHWVKKADHIISLPRISTHAQTGVTLGFKNMVGFLREDSRMEFHANGPFFYFMETHSGGLSGNGKKFNAPSFFHKITEISDAVRKKLRLTVFTATKLQTTMGPDSHTAGIIPSHVVIPTPGVCIASSDQVMGEASALAFLMIIQKKVSIDKKIVQRFLRFVNPLVQDLETTSVWGNPFIAHALELQFGYKRSNVQYKNIPKKLESEFAHVFVG